MKLLTTAKLTWFDDGCCDVKYLDLWDGVSLSYWGGRPNGPGWTTDQYVQRMGCDPDGRLFQNAADRLMRYRFYPPDVMAHYGDFDLHERWLKVGDRIVQRIHVFHLFGWAILDALGLTEITQVVNQPRRVGFTYTTTAQHVIQGKWTAMLFWQEDGEVVLTIDALSRPKPDEPARTHAFMRRLQKRAHQRGLAHFFESVSKQIPLINS